MACIDHGGVPVDGRAPGGRQPEGHQYPLQFRGSGEGGLFLFFSYRQEHRCLMRPKTFNVNLSE